MYRNKTIDKAVELAKQLGWEYNPATEWYSREDHKLHTLMYDSEVPTARLNLTSRFDRRTHQYRVSRFTIEQVIP